MNEPILRPEAGWASIRPLFAWDGSLRDVVILGCSLADWREVFRALERSEATRVVYPGSHDPGFWRDPGRVLERYRGQAILVRSRGLVLKCDIVSSEIIEFDLDPRQIASAEALEHLIRLMQVMSDAVNKPVLLTEEGDHDSVLLAVRPDLMPG